MKNPTLFLNLSNHPLAGWTAPQLDAARKLGLGEPRDLAGGLPLVPPEADTAQVRTMAQELVERALELGTAGAFVAGDYYLSFALVAGLQARGVRCFTATTERVVHEEAGDDDAIRRSARFRFVRWREYGDQSGPG